MQQPAAHAVSSRFCPRSSLERPALVGRRDNAIIGTSSRARRASAQAISEHRPAPHARACEAGCGGSRLTTSISMRCTDRTGERRPRRPALGAGQSGPRRRLEKWRVVECTALEIRWQPSQPVLARFARSCFLWGFRYRRPPHLVLCHALLPGRVAKW